MFSNNHITSISLRCDVLRMRTVCYAESRRSMLLMKERKMRSLLISPLLFTG